MVESFTLTADTLTANSAYLTSLAADALTADSAYLTSLTAINNATIGGMKGAYYSLNAQTGVELFTLTADTVNATLLSVYTNDDSHYASYGPT